MAQKRFSLVALIATKGGAGKSTVAVNLAIAAALRKRKVLLIDFDQHQLSSYLWLKGVRRKGVKPAFQKGSLETLGQDLEAARGKFDLVIIDCGAGNGPEVVHIATIAEHILIPVRATTFDLSGTRNTIDLLRNSADNTEPEDLAFRNALGKAAIVLNAVPLEPGEDWDTEIAAALGSCNAGGIRILGRLSNREAYVTSLEDGKGVTEEKDDPAAVAETFALYKGLLELESERAARTSSVRRK